MPSKFAAGVAMLFLFAGCSHLRPAPSTPDFSPPAAVPGAPSSSTESHPDGGAIPAVVQPSPAATPGGGEPTAVARTPVDRGVSEANLAPEVPSAARTTTAAKNVTKPTAISPPVATPNSTASGKPQTPPSLDLAALEQRLRDTRAVGLFTKLSLKNQVDDLLAQVRSYYRGNKPPPPAELRPRFDGLLMKVLSVVQDGDPSLATQIWSSREALWGVLADPAKFEKI